MQSIEVDGVHQPLAAAHPSLSFTASSVGIGTGCNGIGGPYVITDGHVDVEVGSMTLKACGGSVGAQESAFSEMFLGRPDEATISLAGPAAAAADQARDRPRVRPARAGRFG